MLTAFTTLCESLDAVSLVSGLLFPFVGSGAFVVAFDSCVADKVVLLFAGFAATANPLFPLTLNKSLIKRSLF